jgi:hypothetical protein
MKRYLTRGRIITQGDAITLRGVIYGCNNGARKPLEFLAVRRGWSAAEGLAKADAAAFIDICVAALHTLLHHNGAPNRINDRRELQEKTVSHGLTGACDTYRPIREHAIPVLFGRLFSSFEDQTSNAHSRDPRQVGDSLPDLRGSPNSAALTLRNATGDRLVSSTAN